MDVIALGKAMKAKRAMKNMQDRLGMNGTENGLDVVDVHANVKARLEALEARQEGYREAQIVFDTDDQWNTGSYTNTHSNAGIISIQDTLLLNGTWETSSLDLGEDVIGLTSINVTGSGLTSAQVYTKTENDTEYVLLNSDGTIASKHGHTLQIKVELTSGETPPEIDKLVVHYKVRPLVSRVSDVEENTAVNLNKHNLHINTLLNKSKYGLTDLAFDDFADDSGIDASKSHGHSFDAPGRRMKMAEGATQAEVVTTAEVTESIPRMIAVSQTFNEQLIATQSMDLTSGVYTNTEIVGGEIKITSPDGGLTFSSSGSYETPVLDVGDNFKALYKLNNLLSLPEGTSISLSTSTSQDGNTFSEYLPINSDNTIASPSARYIQVKAELYGGSETQEVEIQSVVEYDATNVINVENSYGLTNTTPLWKLVHDIHDAQPVQFDSLTVKQSGSNYTLVGTLQ